MKPTVEELLRRTLVSLKDWERHLEKMTTRGWDRIGPHTESKRLVRAIKKHLAQTDLPQAEPGRCEFILEPPGGNRACNEPAVYYMHWRLCPEHAKACGHHPVATELHS